MILAGDIGGTKTVLALFEEREDGLCMAGEPFVVPSAEFAGLEQVVKRFLAERSAPRPSAACFGAAGAVIGGRIDVTNLPWILEEQALVEATGAKRVVLLNDLEAAAYGMLVLRPDEFETLRAGATGARGHNLAVIAAGTGLGEAVLYWDGAQHRALASEGGHADLAPRSERQIELLRWLRGELGEHVSYERVLSGPGIHNVYRFLRAHGAASESADLARRIDRGDPAAEIARGALERRDPLCVETLELFAEVYGAEAGNLVLRYMALGGVFVGGGIAPKILPLLRRSAFLDAFTAKGRFARMLERTAVRIALNPRAPLLGAAHRARGL